MDKDSTEQAYENADTESSTKVKRKKKNQVDDNSSDGEGFEEETDDYEYEKNNTFVTSKFISKIWENSVGNKFCYYIQNDYDVENANKQVHKQPGYSTKEITWDNETSDYRIQFKAYKNIPKCILYPFRTNGAIRTKSFIKANLIWKLMKHDKMSKLITKLNYFQKFNHFPCTWQLGRKDNMFTNFSKLREKFPKDFEYVPNTYIMPKDLDRFFNEATDPLKKWILKPVASSRGRGIKIITCKDKIPTKCLISHYIDNPHTINNKKYDLRIYVVVTNFTPLKIYMYNEGLARFASEEYNLEDTENNKYMHLTNYSVNKTSTNVDKTISNDHELLGIKWSLTSLKTYFKENGINYSSLEEKIKDIVVKTILSITDETIKEVKSMTSLPNSLFELYGFDIMIDSNFRPWLIEVNLNPSLDSEAQIDNKIKSSLISDIINMLGLIPYSRTVENRSSKFPNAFAHITTETSGKNSIELNKITSSSSVDIFQEYETELETKGVKLESESDLLDYFLKKHYDLKGIKSDMSYDKWETDIILTYEEEVRRKGNFSFLFPLKESQEAYSRYISDPGRENLILWNWIRNKRKEYLNKWKDLKTLKGVEFFDE